MNGKLAAGANLTDSSPEHGQSVEPLVSSDVRDEEIKETMKSLNEKLSSALLTIRAKEDLVKQHAKVTEEAVAGKYWSLVNFSEFTVSECTNYFVLELHL